MSALCHAEAIPEHEVDNQSEDSEPVTDHKQSNWKPRMVAMLSITEMALDGLPIPAAKGCISLLLKVIIAVDVAADNEEVIKELQARYEDLTEFLRSISTDVPSPVQQDVKALQKKLKRLAKRWEPRLTKRRKRDYFMKLFRAHDEHDMLNGFLHKTKQAINDFLLRAQVQSCILTYREILKNRHVTVISSMLRAHYASYKTLRPGRGEPCMKDTRMSLRERIDKWALNPDPRSPPIFWLNGLAGIGKTTVAHSVAMELDAKHQLGGSFLFLRTDDQLTNGNLVFPTLAFQLSSFNTLFKTQLAQVLEYDPGCVTESPKIQFEKLIRQPLSAISISKPLILVLDALDECHPDSLEPILWVIVNSVKRIPFLRVFITSRPEGQIREGLAVEGDHSARQNLVLHEDMHIQEEVEKDIRLYLKTSLQEIWQKDNQGEWPREKDLETLVEHSGKLFIYAATMVRFIGGNRTLDPERQLGILLNVKVGHIPVSDLYRRLDQLYLNILDAALPAELLDDPHYLQSFHKVVGSIVLMQKPLPLEALARFLGDCTVPKIKRTLYHLHSIIIVPDHALDSPHTYHLSFPNFITTSRRCTNKKAYINSQRQEQYLFLRCLDLMSNFFGPVIERKQRPKTRRNTIDFVDSRTDAQDVGQPSGDDSAYDFYEGDMSMTPEVRYSNNHWCSHLINTHVKPKPTEEEDSALPAEELEELISALERFINDYLSQWINRRTDRILLTNGATKMKLAQDTFDIMYNAHRWMAANIDSRRSQEMKQILQTDARKAFACLFPSAPKNYNYTLGHRLNEQVLLEPKRYLVFYS